MNDFESEEFNSQHTEVQQIRSGRRIETQNVDSE
jgi:hypothetical protein